MIFVNDINVTGAQQRIMRRYFETVGAAQIHWLYIIDVENPLGREVPQIEYALNNLQYASFDEFANFVATADIDFTSKCIARVLSYDVRELARLLGILSERRRWRILALTLQEGRYGGDALGEDRPAEGVPRARSIVDPPPRALL